MGSFLKNFLLAFIAILLFLGACEIFLRIGGYKAVTFYAISGFYQFDPELGWTGIPNHQSTFRARDFEVDVRTNSYGFRDREYPLKKASEVKRIVVLGDSFTWGWGGRK